MLYVCVCVCHTCSVCLKCNKLQRRGTCLTSEHLKVTSPKLLMMCHPSGAPLVCSKHQLYDHTQWCRVHFSPYQINLVHTAVHNICHYGISFHLIRVIMVTVSSPNIMSHTHGAAVKCCALKEEHQNKKQAETLSPSLHLPSSAQASTSAPVAIAMCWSSSCFRWGADPRSQVLNVWGAWSSWMERDNPESGDFKKKI